MSALLFYMHDGPKTFRFELSGDLEGVEVSKLDQAWRTASSTFDDKVIVVDITFLKSIDNDGRRLLERWARAGAQFVANSVASREVAASITGHPYEPVNPAVGPTFNPRYVSAFRTMVAALVLTVTLLFPAKASGAELKKETLDAWNRSLASAKASMLERTRGQFLWIDETPSRLNRVRTGEVVVAPMGHTPEGVRGGLVHHWIGAAFIPGARMEDVIGVVRNYNRYTEFYRPSVIDSKTLSQKAEEDRFSVVMVNKAMFMKRALDSEYQARFVQVDSGKWYNIAETTRLQEVSEEGPIPDGEGSGYIWRLCTMSRFEERDHGVYIETEALALSRPIPTALHWVVDPIVRRVSRESLALSIGQTRDATGSAIKSEAALSATRRVRIRHDAANQ